MSKDSEERVPGEDRDQRHDQPDEDEAEVAELGIDPDRPTCPKCGWHNTRLSHTKTIVDTVFKAFSLRAFRCRSCGNRFRALRRARKT